MNITKTLLALGLMGLVATAANAQTIPDTTGGIGNADANQEGDLILGFSNTSASNELVVDLGSATDFYSASNALASENTAVSGGLAAGTTYTVAAYTASDLTTAFGAGKDYSSSTSWAVVGGNGSGGGPGSEATKTLWLTGSGLTSQAQAIQSGPSVNIDGMTNNASGANNSGLASVDAGTEAKVGSTTFTSVMGDGSFGINEGSLVATTAAAGSGTVKLELYELLPSDAANSGPATVDLGYFTLSSTGLTFTTIPEPSTYAAILGALTVGFVMIRRRTQSSAVSALV